MPDTPEARLRAALDALHPSARYVRVEAIDLAAYLRHIDALTAAVEGLTWYEDRNGGTWLGRGAVLAILRGEQ